MGSGFPRSSHVFAGAKDGDARRNTGCAARSRACAARNTGCDRGIPVRAACNTGCAPGIPVCAAGIAGCAVNILVLVPRIPIFVMAGRAGADIRTACVKMFRLGGDSAADSTPRPALGFAGPWSARRMNSRRGGRTAAQPPPARALSRTHTERTRAMANSWIPTLDGPLDTFVNNFQTLIAASPTAYGLVAGDATAITAAYTAWHAAYLAAVNPTTRTHATITTKNVQKANVLSVVRGYGATIRVNRAITDALKIGLGLHIRDTVPTPVPPPSTYPLLTIDSFNLGTLELHAADQDTPDKKARPTGTSGLLLFSIVGPEPAIEPTGLAFNAFLTRPKFENTFSPADSGKTVTYFGRWTNGKGELGPWSPPVSIRIAA